MHGYYDCTFELEGGFEQLSLSNLRDTIRSSIKNHTGWPAFTGTNNAAYPASPVSGAIEFWNGPNEDGSYKAPHHHDFWRISQDGLLFIRRGYPEDSGWKNMEPGRCFDIVTINKRLAETIMEACYIGQALQVKGNMRCHFKLTGLAGRELVSNDNPNRTLFDGHCSKQNEYETNAVVSIPALPDALPELVYSITSPLFELFNFFQLPKRLVDQEVTDLLHHRY